MQWWRDLLGGADAAAAHQEKRKGLAQGLRGPGCPPPTKPSVQPSQQDDPRPNFPSCDPRVAVWLSVDPRSGRLVAYPSDPAKRIEEGFAKGEKVVNLCGFGGFFQHASVVLKGSKTGRPQQISRGGHRRDVRRLEVLSSARTASLHVFQEAGWHVADDPVEGKTQERTLELMGFEKTPALVSGAQAGAQSFAEAVAAGDAAGQVALWEWCKLARADLKHDLPEDKWGLYDEAVNDVIEAAFRAAKKSVKIVLGIRTYEVVFDSATSARQVDHALKKSRHVRRRLLAPTARDQLCQAAQAAQAALVGDDDECPICCNDFSETRTLQIVRLPECKHVFHRACIQNSADRKEACPLCRAEVDWARALSSSNSQGAGGR